MGTKRFGSPLATQMPQPLAFRLLISLVSLVLASNYCIGIYDPQYYHVCITSDYVNCSVVGYIYFYHHTYVHYV